MTSARVAADDELRSALRAFRAGLAGAYEEEPRVLEGNFRAAVARYGTAEAARMARTGHSEVGTLRHARTVAERARLRDAGRPARRHRPRRAGAGRAHPHAGRRPGGAHRPAARVPLRGSPSRLPGASPGGGGAAGARAGGAAARRHLRAGGEGSRRAAPERVREAFEAYQDEMARRTGPLPRAQESAPGIAARLLELADRFRSGLRSAYEDPQRAEQLYHRLVASDLAPEVAERVERNPALLGSLRDDPGARRTAAEAAGVGAQAYRIHLGDPRVEVDALVAAALAHERAQAQGREAGRLHDDRLRAAQVLAELDAAERAASAALAALDAAFAGAFVDGTGATRLFRQAVALRGAASALEQLRSSPTAFGTPAGRPGDERRRHPRARHRPRAPRRAHRRSSRLRPALSTSVNLHCGRGGRRV